jgi:alkanesulfonate monooxygenase SsuD/methylene tetrahydromethanopterin reductase-like flavin-dependent oxidoreductase (luciferase family)
MLARRVTALDVFSRGRVKGLGLGWSKDEYEAAGAISKDRGPFADEFIQVLKGHLDHRPVGFHGKFFHVPKSIIQPKPVQKPHPPIYLAAYAPPL